MKRTLVDIGNGKKFMESVGVEFGVCVKKVKGYDFKEGQIIASFQDAVPAGEFAEMMTKKYAPTTAYTTHDTLGHAVEVEADDSFVRFSVCYKHPALPLGGSANALWTEQVSQFLPRSVATAWQRWDRRQTDINAAMDRE